MVPHCGPWVGGSSSTSRTSSSSSGSGSMLFNFGKLVHDSNEMKTLHLSCATKVIKGWTEAMPLMVGSQTNGCWLCPGVKTYQLYLQIGTKASGFLHKVFTWIMCSYFSTWH